MLQGTELVGHGGRMRMGARPTNWAGNVTFTARAVHHPASVDELRRLVAGSRRIRALGTGHSFNRVADAGRTGDGPGDGPGDLVSLAGLPPAIEVGPDRRTVTVGAGVRYGELARHLHRTGLALHNLGSLPHLSVGGACATGTHGSGDGNGSLATAVSALTLVTTGGELVTLSRAADGDGSDGDGSDGDDFHGAVVALGCLGVVTSLTLDVQPAFDVRQYVYDGLPREALDEHFDEVLGAGYSVSLFTDWSGPRIGQVWVKRRDRPGDRPPEPRWLGARLADGPRHPLPDRPTAACTPQLGVPGPWHERLPHFQATFTPSSGQELQSELLLPRRHAVEALAAVARLAGLVTPVLQVSEIRTVAADPLWLSPSYRRDSVALHFTWVPDPAAVEPVVAAVEAALAPYDPRPHWGKLFAAGPASLARCYRRLPDFRRLVHRYDPAGTFGNELTDRWLGVRR